MEDKTKWPKKDIIQIISAIIITILFSLREYPFPKILFELLRHLWAFILYSLGTVLIMVGLAKKIFKYNPTKIQIIKWAAYLAALCAISEFLHEGFKVLTGQAG